MGTFNELRKEWIVTLKTLKSISTQALYFLLEPDDDNKFFESVDSFKDCIEGTEFTEFQMLAIEYLLGYKKQNKPEIKTESYTVYTPNTDNKWPFGPLDNDQIQKATKPNTIPNIMPDSIAPTSIAHGIAADFVRYVGKPLCRCTDCEFFDGYDTCLHHMNLGAITQQTLDNCKKHNLLKEKLYGT